MHIHASNDLNNTHVGITLLREWENVRWLTQLTNDQKAKNCCLYLHIHYILANKLVTFLFKAWIIIMPIDVKTLFINKNVKVNLLINLILLQLNLNYWDKNWFVEENMPDGCSNVNILQTEILCNTLLL